MTSTTMTRGRAAIGRALGLTALLAIALAVSAEAPAQRVLRRQQAEALIAGVEERLAAVQPDGQVAESTAALARQQAVLARKLLARGNHRAAKAMADQADALLKRIEPKGEVQQ